MYGSGLRLTELLRLRIKDVDLDRLRVTVRAGKGDKDRMTVLPEKLVEGLRAHRDRVRELYESDRSIPTSWPGQGWACAAHWTCKESRENLTPTRSPPVGTVVFIRTCQHIDGSTDLPEVTSARVPAPPQREAGHYAPLIPP
jgi:integrase